MPDASKKQTVVMVSSTARDLPEHRKEVLDACLRMGMLPVMMEHLTAGDADAAEKSLAMVDGADIYMGVFAYRYGYVPEANNPGRISITEMEYDRAVERGIPRLMFLMDKSHTLTAADMEEDTTDPVEVARRKVKLAELKERSGKERVVASFKSPVDLRALVIQALVEFREPDLTTFHYVSDIPAPPEPFIAHPYTLLQMRDLVGRNKELNALTDWVAKPGSQVYGASIFNIVAIGGMGKSALTWKWFNDIAPQEMKSLAGRMWWSFYESDATFENFVIRALAYVTKRSREEIEKNVKLGEREEQLLAALDREPFLLVLDGLERILIAYARMDANRLADDDLDERAANHVAGALGLPESAAHSFVGQHILRKTTDPRAGNFLRKLARIRASRILVSTRLYPADLQSVTGAPLPGSVAYFLRGLNDDDALNLWRGLGVTGSREELLRLFRSFESHPLLIQALASEVAYYPPARGDFDRWRRAKPAFNPFGLPLNRAQSHVLAFALRGLDDTVREVLNRIAAFRMPATYDTLTTLMVGDGNLFADENALVASLAELEDRGLLGWDRRANRYDLHPIVRGVVWNDLGEATRLGVYTSLQKHFEVLPMIDDHLKVNSLEDLTPAIELYNTLIGLGRYDEAFIVFRDRLEYATLYRLSASRQRVELLEMLFPDGLVELPRLSSASRQAYAFAVLAHGYRFDGLPGRANLLYRRAISILSENSNDISLGICLYSLSNTLLLSGVLRKSTDVARRALPIIREQRNYFEEGVCLLYLGLTLVGQGVMGESESASRRALRIFVALRANQMEGVANSYLAQRELWLGDSAAALLFAKRAWELAHAQSYERDLIEAARRQGAAALGLGDFTTADERLHHALTRARKVNLVEGELPTLVALAELRRQQGDWGVARELLGDVWEAAERGPYPLFHADACCVLAEIERDEGNNDKAVEAARRAYELAWCDGPPFAYHWGLERARGLLRGLGAGEPSMPAFDESKYEPMPEVEIDPADEFGAGTVEGEEAEE
jgi:tetratricopeptide (TPR) repeat protein